MASCFSLSFDPHSQPKLPCSFLKPLCFPFCHVPFSTSSPSSLPFDDDDGAADESDLNNHHVIILEIRQRAMMKARSQTRSSFMIMTEEELARLIKAAPPKVNKSDDADGRGKKDGECEGEDDNEEEFFSVRSCFSRCSSGEDEYCLSRRMRTAAAVTLSEEWFRECEGWPFGLWRRRKVVVLPPLPKSPADSWSWHKRNLSSFKV